jgi:hypothetical protein
MASPLYVIFLHCIGILHKTPVFNNFMKKCESLGVLKRLHITFTDIICENIFVIQILRLLLVSVLSWPRCV